MSSAQEVGGVFDVRYRFGRFPQIVGVLWRTYGFRVLWVVINRLCDFWWHVLVGPKRFEFNGTTLRYFYHLANPTFRCERSVEVPLALHYLGQYQNPDVLEVGNVLVNYFAFPHEVVDKYEKDQAVHNVDIVDFKTSRLYDVIITISTLEHVGWDEPQRDADKIPKAIAHLKQMLKPGGVMLATMPLGYNEFLDEVVRSKRLEFDEVYFMRRESASNAWSVCDYAAVADARFDSPYPCANALVIGVSRNRVC